MYRPNRIGPWPLGDIEVPVWEPGATLRGVIDDVAFPLVGGGVRSVTVPEVTNFETFALALVTMTPTQRHAWAFGCLINGVNQEPDNKIIYSISGAFQLMVGTAATTMGICPIIAKLDATPSDPDAAITITDYQMLPMATYQTESGLGHWATVNTQMVVGDMRGSTSVQSDLPIFVGWMQWNLSLTNA